MKYRSLSLAVALAAVPCFTAGKPLPADLHALEPLVVTATRVPVPEDRVTQAMTIIDRATIEQRQAVRIVDLLRDVPGLAVSQAGADGSQTQVRVRGAESNHLLVMIDGVEVNDPANADDFRFEYLMAADVERVEIVRGPQSALWGTDALAGVINIITRRGGGPTAGSAYLETGSNATFHGGASMSFGGDALRGHVGAMRYRTDGTNISRRGAEDDGVETSTLTASIAKDFSPDTGLDASVRLVDARSDIDAIDFVNTGLPTDARRFNDARRGSARLRARWGRTGSLKHEASLSYLDTDNENRGNDIEPSSNGAERLGLRYQASWEWLPGQFLTAALDHEEQDFRQRGVATPFGDPNQDQDMQQTGLVLDYLGHAGNAWDWNLSARRDRHSDFEDVTTWRAGLGFRPDARSRIRLVAGTGRKAPTFTDRFGFFADAFVGNPALEPEESRSLELGYERDIGPASFALTLFEQDLENEINGFVFDPASGLFTAVNEPGESRRSGVELAAGWSPAPRWKLVANYTYTDATQPEGERRVDEIRRPRHLASLNLNYASEDGRGNVNLNVNYNGSQTDTFFPPFPEAPRTVALDGFVLVDLAARWRLTPKVELFGRLENLLDEDYEEIFGFATPGRTAVAGLRYRFGQ